MTAARFSARTVLGGLIAASLVGAGVAVAAVHASSGGSPSVSLVQAAASASPSPSAGHGRHGIKGFLGEGPGDILRTLVNDTGLTPEQIAQGIAAGKTLDEIAGSNAGKVKADALAAVKTALDAAVARNVFTAEQETSLLADAKDAIDQVMAAKLGNAGLGSLMGPGRGMPGMPGMPFFHGPHHGQAQPSPSASASGQGA